MTELRLALAMRGGVSLAVWIGGACAEIDELRRAGRGGDDPGAFWARLLTSSGRYDTVVVDVLTGASAGGLNGVVFATAIRHGFPMRDLEDVWLELGGVDRLRRPREPWLSLFDGDARFLDDVQAQLAARAGGGAPVDGCVPEPDHAIDLQLSATLVEPLVLDAPTIDQEAQRRKRWASRFHFRHDPSGALGRRDLEGDEGSLWRLAVAARATSSFPGAFEAAMVRSTRRTDDSIAPPPLPAVEPPQGTGDVPGRRIDCRGVFQERRGSDRGRGALLHPHDFVVSDGGIVDNIPLGKAIESIQRSPADGPTRRVLVYLHPTGPATTPPAPTRKDGDDATMRRRGSRAVVTGLVGAHVEGEDISGDIIQLEAHNAAVERSRVVRRSSFVPDPSTGSSVPPVFDAWQRAVASFAAYRVQRAAADAASLRHLLDDPLAVLGEDPFPLLATVPEDRWRAPLAAPAWAGHRVDLDTDLFIEFHEAIPSALTADGSVLVTGGLGPLRRTILRLIEVLVAADRVGDEHLHRVGGPSALTPKQRLYRLLGLVDDVLVRARRLAWVRRAVTHPPASTTTWCNESLDFLDGRLLVSEQEATALVTGEPGAGSRYADALWLAVEGVELGGADDAVVDIRHRVLDEVEAAVHGVQLPSFEAPEPHPAVEAARPLRDAIIGTAGTGEIDAAALVPALAALEVVTLAEALTGAATATPIEWRRMSAAEPTPLAARFVKLHVKSEQLGPPPQDVPADRWLAPSVKLAGNELGNFSAFLRRTWRANDWLWGRLDAVPTLVDLLLGPDDPPKPEVADMAGLGTGTSRTAVRDALVERRQRQILGEQLGVDDAALDVCLARYAVGLETVHVPGNDDIRRSVADLAAVGVNVAAAAGGPSVQRYAGLLGRVARWVAAWWARPRRG